MKRKKWSEREEQTLLSKYSDLLNSGALCKLKTREKRFRPIAEHVNSLHHLRDPVTFPFRWSWRDVSIKVQNMRHQYLGVKQKIRVSADEFNWSDGEIHWENFLHYKEVFGDVELDSKGKRAGEVCLSGDGCDLGFEISSEELDAGDEEEETDADREVTTGKDGEMGFTFAPESKVGLRGNKGFGSVAGQLRDLRVAMVRREEKKREREFEREGEELEREGKRREMELQRGERENERIERIERREIELDEEEQKSTKVFSWWRRVLEEDLEKEREIRRRMEEEEMEWRERMLGLQMEHEKAMMEMHIEALQSQMQLLGMVTRLLCQSLGSSANDGFSGALGILAPQVLQGFQHPGDNANKPDSTSPSDFM